MRMRLKTHFEVDLRDVRDLRSESPCLSTGMPTSAHAIEAIADGTGGTPVPLEVTDDFRLLDAA